MLAGKGSGKPRVIPAPRKGARLRNVALHLTKDNGDVTLFISVGNYHMNPSGAPGKDWKYGSPKSVVLEVESRRGGPTVAHIIEKAEYLSEMLGIPIIDEIFGIPIDWKPRNK